MSDKLCESLAMDCAHFGNWENPGEPCDNAAYVDDSGYYLCFECKKCLDSVRDLKKKNNNDHQINESAKDESSLVSLELGRWLSLFISMPRFIISVFAWLRRKLSR